MNPADPSGPTVDEQHRLFGSIASPTAALIRTTDLIRPDLLNPGDMVICPDLWGADEFVNECRERGIHVRTGAYRYEDEEVFSRTRGKAPTLSSRGVRARYTNALGALSVTQPADAYQPDYTAASTEAFARTWDALAAPMSTSATYSEASTLIPSDWVSFLPYPTLNPAQVQALPALLSEDPAFIVAPTGAGKTVMGMLAALREIKGRGRKAAWLVPQRTLTAELDRDLDLWRRQGLKVVALSGEVATDTRATQEADLWVATTEKFEALCRASSMRNAIAQIGTLVVDEIHLLGEPSRGPLLESLLARIRGENSPVRLVGLSATAANAEDIAAWLGATLVEIAWRPTRQTHQILTIPTGDRATETRLRNGAAATITDHITRDGGSVLVFCGSKANVRSTALAIARARGVDIADVQTTDLDAVRRACDQAGVGLHYSDWPAKRAAEQDYRERRTNVLVATTTLAAGVNTPARAVIVRDTSIGMTSMEVSTIQQMFGRAGRAGMETEGWAFLLATPDEASEWRTRLAQGYTIVSGLQGELADHLLGEIVQGNVTTLRSAERWWASTLAYHQGNHATEEVTRAREVLETGLFIESRPGTDGDTAISATPLGQITSKMMVNTTDAASLVMALRKMPLQRNPATAEATLVQALSDNVASFCLGQESTPEQAPSVTSILAAGGFANRVTNRPRLATNGSQGRAPGREVARAAMLVAARSPRAFLGTSREVLGVSRALFNAALYESPRYFAWLAAAAQNQAVPGWVGPVAHDLGRRIAWYRTTPEQGHGRLLWLCERMVGPHDPATNVPRLFTALRKGGVNSPEQWPVDPPDVPGLTPQRQRAVQAGLVPLGVSDTEIVTSPNATALTHDRHAWGVLNLTAGRGERAAERPVVVFGQTGDVRGSDWMVAFAAAQAR